MLLDRFTSGVCAGGAPRRRSVVAISFLNLQRVLALCLTLHAAGVSAAWIVPGYTVEQLTFSGINWDPALNNLGEYVYSIYVGSSLQIVSNVRGQISADAGDHRYAQVNDLGEVTWQVGGTLYSSERGAFGAAGTLQYRADLNDSGDLLWAQIDAPGQTQVHLKDIDDNESVAVAWDDPVGAPMQGTAINDVGEMIWRPLAAGTDDLGLYSNTRGFLFEQVDEHFDPQINDDGEVVWYAHDANEVWQIWLYNLDNQVVQLTDGSVDARWVDINDLGQIMWTQHDGLGNWNIYRASPVPEINALLLVSTGLVLLVFTRQNHGGALRNGVTAVRRC